MSDYLNEMFKDLGGLEEFERKHIDSASNANTGNYYRSRAVSDIYLAKTYNKITDSLIKSNERISKSSEKHAKALNLATYAIAGFALVQVVIIIIDLFNLIPKQ